MEEATLRLTHVFIITDNIERMLSFYRDVLLIEPQPDSGNYVEFVTEGTTLSLGTVALQESLAPGSAKPASNHSTMFEIQVDDVDKEYERLQKMDIEWVKPPTTQPWGNRSIYFRDPDGNLLNFYTRVAQQQT